MNQLFASYPINNNYQCIYKELYEVLKLCIIQYIHNKNGKHKQLQSKVPFIEFMQKCIKSHSYFMQPMD